MRRGHIFLWCLLGCALDRGPIGHSHQDDQDGGHVLPDSGDMLVDAPAADSGADSMAHDSAPVDVGAGAPEVDGGDAGWGLGIVWEMQITEVSVGQFQTFLDDGGTYTPKVPGDLNCNYPERPEHPMNCIRRDEAEAYCGWYGGRLPTGDEWRALAGSSWWTYPWGDDPPDCDKAHYMGCPGDDGAATKRIGTTAQHGNFWDLAGNVFEWMSAGYIKGGSFVSAPAQLELDYRSGNHRSPEQQHIGIGFRCIREVAP